MIARSIVALCAALPLVALAFSSSTSGNQTTFGAFTATPSNIAPYTVSTASDGRVLVSSASRIPLAGGGSFPVTVTGAVPRANAAAAIGRFLLKGSGVIGVLGLGVAAYELAQELGFTLDNSSGSTQAQKPRAGACAVAPCFEYRYVNDSPAYATAYFPTIAQVMSADVALFNSTRAYSSCAGNPLGNFVTARVGDVTSASAYRIIRGTQLCNAGQPQGAVTDSFSARTTQSRSRAPDTSLTEPATLAELQAAIEAQNVWNPNSKLGSALRDAVAAGEPVAVPTPAVTGPATVPGASSTTVDDATGETTTATQIVEIIYDGPKVIPIVVTTTVVTDTATGAPIRQSVKTESPVAELPVSPNTETPPFVMPCGVAGTPPCAVKVDETGTPTTVADLADPQTRGEEVTAPIDPVVANPEGFWPSLPTLSWAFSLPSGCSVISLPAFSPWLPAVDVCEFQPMFHDLMTVVWSVGALLGLVSLFWRNVFAGVPA